MIIKNTVIDTPILQNLIPVLTKDGVLRGLIHTGVNKWSGASEKLIFPTRTLDLVAKAFHSDTGIRKLMCVEFPVTLSSSNYPWNGIPGFIPADKMGYFSVWAIPVLNPGYNRADIGELNLFVSNKLDPSESKKGNDVNVTNIGVKKSYIVKASVSVSLFKFPKRFSFVEFNWVDLFRRKLKAAGIEENSCFLSVQCIQSPPTFKTICYNSNNTSSVPYILQILRISRDEVDVGVYDFVLEVEGTNKYLFNISLNVRS